MSFHPCFNGGVPIAPNQPFLGPTPAPNAFPATADPQLRHQNMAFWPFAPWSIPNNPPNGALGTVPGSVVNLPGGVTYLFPTEHASIFVIRSGFDTGNSGPQFSPMFDQLFVPLNLTGNEFIKQAGGGDGWSFLELYESGDGIWRHGQEIKFGDDYAKKKTLKDYGFARSENGKRPVWGYLRKI